MSNKQRTDNLRAIPDPDKADLTPAEKGAATKERNAELKAKKADLSAKTARDDEAQKLQKQMDATRCGDKPDKTGCKNNKWRVRVTEKTFRWLSCVACGKMRKFPR